MIFIWDNGERFSDHEYWFIDSGDFSPGLTATFLDAFVDKEELDDPQKGCIAAVPKEELTWRGENQSATVGDFVLTQVRSHGERFISDSDLSFIGSEMRKRMHAIPETFILSVIETIPLDDEEKEYGVGRREIIEIFLRWAIGAREKKQT